jgi:hypothetical protein
MVPFACSPVLPTVGRTGVVGQRVYVVWLGGGRGVLMIDKLTRKTSLCSPQKCTSPSHNVFVRQGTSVLVYSVSNLYYTKAALHIYIIPSRDIVPVRGFSM